MMLGPPAVGSSVMDTGAGSGVVLFGGDSSFASKLAGTLAARRDGVARRSPVLESWEGLKDVCKGASTVYLLSTLDLPPLPADSELKVFTAGVGRVVDCCLECGVESLVFTSSAGVVASSPFGNQENDREREGSVGGGANGALEEGLPPRYVTRQEDPREHAVAQAEAMVLQASGRAGPSSSRCLHTCALRPAAIYGASDQSNNWTPLHRALSLVGWGLNRVGVGAKKDAEAVRSDTVHVDNLVEAHLLAGDKLNTSVRDAAAAEAIPANGVVEKDDAGADADREGSGLTRKHLGGSSGGGGGGTSNSSNMGAPACSGQAYFVTDGQPSNPQKFLDGILDGLGFATSKAVRVPTGVALFAALVAELVCKAGITATPAFTRSDIRALTESRTFSSARSHRDLGYVPRVDPATAVGRTVQSLERAGWARHRVLRPGLGYWVCNPTGIWLVTLAAFGGPCPPFLAPLATNAGNVGLMLLHKLSTVRAVCVAVYIIHVLEGVYAYRVARQVGHRDTALSWFLQTFVLGFPSIGLVNSLRLPQRPTGVDVGVGVGVGGVAERGHREREVERRVKEEGEGEGEGEGGGGVGRDHAARISKKG